MQIPVFSGVCTALVTPFTDSGIDYKKLDELLDFQIESGVEAVCVCGTTGEASTMTEEEILSVIAHTVKFCQGRIRVVAGTGSNRTAQAIVRSQLAGSMGADAVLVVTPYYNKANEHGLVEHYTKIADTAGCPVILYNVPGRTGLNLPPAVAHELSRHPNIVGIKEASGNIAQAVAILDSCAPGFALWSGNDDIIVPLMSIGASGVISVLSNLRPREVSAIVNACLSGDYLTAGILQRRFQNLIQALFSDVNPIPIKAAMNMMGMQVGEPRLPLTPLPPEKAKKLQDAMETLQFLPVT